MQLLSDLSNTEAVARLRAGDEEVFTRLYQACYRMVYLQAMKILGQADQAEQVVQDVFIAVFRSIDKLKDPESLRSWIGGIVVRLALHQRKMQTDSREFALEEEAMFDLLDSGPPVSSPEDTLCERDTGLILGELVDQLPDEQRTAVMLYYYDQCPIKHIASILECAEGTVKSRLNYARKALEKLILQREQRDGVRLHALNPGLLFLAMVLQEQNLAVDPQTMERGLLAVKGALGLTAAAAAGSSAAAATTAASTSAASTATAAASASAAVGAGGGGLTLGSKVAILLVAAAVATGGGVFLATRPPQEPQPSVPVMAVVSPTPTATPSATPSPTPTVTPSATPSPTPSVTPSVTPSPTPTATPSSTPSPSPTPAATTSPTATPRPTPTPTPTPVTPVVENRSMSAELGRGYSFGGQWGNLNPSDAGLPAGLTYSSSNSSVAPIDSSGWFTILSPGTVVLTAVSPQEPNVHYTITVQAKNEVPWDYQLDGITLSVGQSRYHGFSSYSLYTNFTIASTVWSSSNPSVVTVGDQEPTSCQLTANAPGTATISGVVTLRVDSQEGVLTFTDNVSFQVTVNA